jgi:hypothetical protein
VTPLDLDALLHKQERRQVPFAIPRVLSDRLDKLCAVLNGPEGQVGVIYRHELVAALLAHAPERLADLEKLIADYRSLRVREALVGDERQSNVVELRPVKPGRRAT